MRLLDLLRRRQTCGKLVSVTSPVDTREQREALAAEAAELDLACMEPALPVDSDPLRSRWTQEALDFEAEVLERVCRRRNR